MLKGTEAAGFQPAAVVMEAGLLLWLPHRGRVSLSFIPLALMFMSVQVSEPDRIIT